MHELVVGIVNIRITQLGKVCHNPCGDIIPKVLTEKYTGSHLWPVQSCTGVQIAKIMAGSNTNTKFTLLDYWLLGITNAAAKANAHN